MVGTIYIQYGEHPVKDVHKVVPVCQHMQLNRKSIFSMCLYLFDMVSTMYIQYGEHPVNDVPKDVPV